MHRNVIVTQIFLNYLILRHSMETYHTPVDHDLRKTSYSFVLRRD